MFKGWRNLIWLSGLLLLAALANFLWPYVWDSFHEDEVLVTISPETTFITEPVGADGYIDYRSALRERASAGVTPENNAAVALWEVCGPRLIPAEVRPEYFQELDMKSLPQDGDYLREWSEGIKDDPVRLAAVGKVRQTFLAESTAAAEESELSEMEEWELALEQERYAYDLEGWAQTSPWTDEQIPSGGKWMEGNEDHIERLIAGAQRSGYFVPLVGKSEEDPLFQVTRPDVQAIKQAGRALNFYAMGQLGQGQTAQAQRAILASLCWASHASRGNAVIDWLVGMSMEAQSQAAVVSLACSDQLTATELQELQAQLAEIPASMPLEENLDQRERLMMLDCLNKMAQFGQEETLGDGVSESWWQKTKTLRTRRRVDWDALLMKYNTYVELHLRQLSAESAGERQQATQALDQFWDQLESDRTASDPALVWEAGGIDAAWQRRFQTIILPFAATAGQLEKVRDSSQTRSQLLKVVFALGRYRAEHGAYPADLAALVPDYLPRLPTDSFATQLPLSYRLEGEEFVLYSFGPDGKDDNGSNTEDDVAVYSKLPFPSGE